MTPERFDNMKILSIETSCDETAIALLEVSGLLDKPEIKILGNTLLSQAKLHEEYGGVYPSLAKREHQKNLPILLEQTLKQAGLDLDVDTECQQIDFIAVTAGPGLEPALWTGIVFAKELSQKWGKPVLPVNHMEGHIFSVLYGLESPLELPGLALLVSGGHTELVHVRSFGDYHIVGRTMDDAVGEAYDKVARMLGLTYPGGPKVSHLAEISREKRPSIDFKLPRPMLHSGNLNFSYSGLKTAVLYKLKAEGRSDEEYKEDIARAFEDAAIEVLIKKTQAALDELGDIKSLIVAGGVSANSYLRSELAKLATRHPETKLLLPPSELTTDNAIMIGLAGFIQATLHPEKLSPGYIGGALVAEGNLSLNSPTLPRS